ncbi:MAG: Stf0 family sulfotransferase [Cyanobacteria bacterium J06638_38]
MTRRNKVRLAVSWWKAIQSQEWHREQGKMPISVDLKDKYSYEAIAHLFAECSMREAAIQEFFDEGSIIPLTIVYEDFVLSYEKTIRNILDYLELLDSHSVSILLPPLQQLADDVSEEWVQRFRKER